MKPSVLRQHDLVQLSYHLPNRVFTTKVYPLRSSNGSSIIICGHDQGLRILWYGGKSFKTPKATEQPQSVNGMSNVDSMVIDLEEDEPETVQPTNQPAEFEDEDDEVDPSQPYREVLRHVDIRLGTSVLDLAIPPIPADVGEAPPDFYPPLFSYRIVIAMSCADLSIRLVTLPLTPPSPLATDPSKWNVQSVKIFGSATHKDQIASISVSHTAETLDSEGEGDQNKSRSRSRNRLASTTTKSAAAKEWSILIATTSCTGSGLLLIHQIPIDKDHTLASSPEVLLPIQRQFLRCSLSKSVVSFNPCPCPAERHSNVLLTIPDAGCVKIYQVFPPLPYQRGRRGSAATIESTTSSARSTHGSNALSGRFLVTLYPGFVSTNEYPSVPKRKCVLDASWVLHGRAVLALMEDGEWGIWDLEAAGPSSASTTQNLVKGQSSVSGIQGGSLTKFAIKGSVGLAAESKLSTVNAPVLRAGGLAPLTPHTRKMRSDGLFQGTSTKSPTQHSRGGAMYGTICVTQHSGNAPVATSIPEESIILSFRETNTFISSILGFWRSETTGGGSLDSLNSTRPTILPPVRLGGEQQHSIMEIPQLMTTSRSGLFNAARKTPHVLVGTDHRLIIIAPPLSDPEHSNNGGDITGIPTRSLTQKSTAIDQLLLTQGQLDVDGMDRILNGMVTGGTVAASKSLGTSAFGKSVGFQLDDEDNDVEMGMGTPTPKNQQSRNTTLVPSTRAGPRGRLFS